MKTGIVRQFERLLKERNRPVRIYESSIVEKNGALFFVVREQLCPKLVVVHYGRSSRVVDDFEAEEKGRMTTDEDTLNYRICPCDHRNALTLRRWFTFTKPQVIGLTPAIGTGDRVGLATPGHIRAVQRYGVIPVLAQQSIREMERTSRSPRDVIDDVSWSVFQEGFRDGFAADADHVKTEEGIEETFEAGFMMYTIDPSEYVDDEADTYRLDQLTERFEKLPWEDLGCRSNDYLRTYVGRGISVTSDSESYVLSLSFSEESLLRAAVKYSAAIAHVVRLKSRLDDLFADGSYDLEVSVDETSAPTKPLEHLFIALELRRLEIRVQGVALHFVGEFQKAIDYIGDLDEFEKTFRDHALIARSFGPYKLSIHSGSDKFSVYRIVGRLARDIVHLKTAGTSYLESLRIVARHDPDLFREIVHYSVQNYEKDRKTYHISTELSMIPILDKIQDKDLELRFLDDNHGRQLLHVTFGSILTAMARDGKWLFRDRIRKVLIENEDEHYQTIAEHLGRHIGSIWSTK
ncbi:MAG: tagaturonate epimerase family protein [Candidatus Bathyarchaeota archaeon]|nr:tagaturonate epimerase family protein [Candidatus Bathyarchaeota archaeon]